MAVHAAGIFDREGAVLAEIGGRGHLQYLHRLALFIVADQGQGVHGTDLVLPQQSHQEIGNPALFRGGGGGVGAQRHRRLGGGAKALVHRHAQYDDKGQGHQNEDDQQNGDHPFSGGFLLLFPGSGTARRTFASLPGLLRQVHLSRSAGFVPSVLRQCPVLLTCVSGSSPVRCKRPACPDAPPAGVRSNPGCCRPARIPSPRPFQHPPAGASRPHRDNPDRPM